MAEVIHYKGLDYWRTWFFEECEATGLFGVTKNHLGLLRSSDPLSRPPIQSYHPGTLLFLEDAPWYKRLHQPSHRVLGPYEVTAIDVLPADAEVVHEITGKAVVYKEPHPETGPWLKRKVTRTIAGKVVKYNQTPDLYEFYPFRFRIRRARNWNEAFEPCVGATCWLCA